MLERSDALRIGAVAAMFERYGYGGTDALVRARTLYYMQIGYNDADLHEAMEARIRLVPHYIMTFTGCPPEPGDTDELEGFAKRFETGGGHGRDV